MRVLAIGATGFIGLYVVKQLIGQGHEVTVFHRGGSHAELPEALKHIHGNRDQLALHRAALLQVRPDVVIDVVPYTETHANDIVTLFRGKTERIVALSSSDVYRNYDGFRRKSSMPPDPVPLKEEAALRVSYYPYRGYDLEFEWTDDYEKIDVERVFLNEPRLPATILRLPALFGPGDKQHRIEPYLRRMDEERSAILLSERQADWCWTRGYVQDVAASIVMAITDSRAAGSIYNVGYEETLTEREWVCEISKVVGWSGKIVTLPEEHIPLELRQPFNWAYDLEVDTSKIRSELGYVESRTLQTALAETIAWERLCRDKSIRVDYKAEDEVLGGIGL